LCILFYSVFPSFTSLFPSFHLFSLHFSTLVLTLNDLLQGNFFLCCLPSSPSCYLIFLFYSVIFILIVFLFLPPSQASLLYFLFDICQLLFLLILFTSPYDYFGYFYFIPIPAFSLLPTFFLLFLHIFPLHLSSVQVSLFGATLLVHRPSL
jgi:hypothetical protein